MSVLFVEAVLAIMALVLVALIRQGPHGGGSVPDGSVDDGGVGTLGLLVPLFLAPVGSVFGLVLLFIVSVAVVLPLVVLSTRLGRQAPGQVAWLWAPIVAAAVVGGTVVSGGLLAGMGTGMMSWAWLGGTVALTVPLLAVRQVALRPVPIAAGRAFGHVVLWGLVAVVVLAAGGGALATGGLPG
jgi:hypothetical protein